MAHWSFVLSARCVSEQGHWDPDARGAGEGDKRTLHCK